MARRAEEALRAVCRPLASRSARTHLARGFEVLRWIAQTSSTGEYLTHINCVAAAPFGTRDLVQGAAGSRHRAACDALPGERLTERRAAVAVPPAPFAESAAALDRDNRLMARAKCCPESRAEQPLEHAPSWSGCSCRDEAVKVLMVDAERTDW
jgi:hypothetical protein